MKLKVVIYTLLQVHAFLFVTGFKFEDITNEVFPLGEDIGIIAAFGHFNFDEYTDIVSLQSAGKKLQILEGSENHPYLQISLNCSFKSEILGVVPGDYNGDSLIDILIVFFRSKESKDVVILWGSKDDTRNCKTDYLFTLQEQPLVIDFNGDMLPDILGQKDGEIYVWISSRDKMFTNRTLKTNQKLRQYHSSGLIDLNNDMSPDMLIMGERHIETWYNTGKGFIKNDSTSIPYPQANRIWKSTFIDMNLNGKLDHIMTVCNDDTCHSSAVLIWNESQQVWEVLLKNFTNPSDHSTWGFKLPMGSALQMEALPPTLRAGDFNMDGYPDFITVLQSKSVFTDTKAVIMRNVPCETCYSGRTIEILWDVPGLKDIQNVQIAAFFDIFEDGTLDILASSNNNREGWKIHALRNTEIFDSCFLKVLVLGGLCHPNKSTEPYGVNQPGPMVRYNMTTQEGRPLVSTAIQLSQSAHFPLQLPYSLFGLGQTPNFIDVLTVSVPATFNQTVHRREWIQIIPNSQIVVIPYPPDDEKRWVKKLYVTPSHLVLMTCISLVGTCIFLCLLVALLHWRERREDKKEKMQDACKFHFDAM